MTQVVQLMKHSDQSLDTANLAKINFLVLGTFKGGASEEKTPCKMQIGLV